MQGNNNQPRCDAWYRSRDTRRDVIGLSVSLTFGIVGATVTGAAIVTGRPIGLVAIGTIMCVGHVIGDAVRIRRRLSTVDGPK